jgi:dynein heavy chain
MVISLCKALFPLL